MKRWMMIFVAATLLAIGGIVAITRPRQPGSLSNAEVNGAILIILACIVSGVALIQLVSLFRHRDDKASTSQPVGLRAFYFVVLAGLLAGLLVLSLNLPTHQDNLKVAIFIGGAGLLVVLSFVYRMQLSESFHEALMANNYRRANFIASLEPNNDWMLAMLYRYQGRYDESDRLYTRLIHQFPNNAVFYNDRSLTRREAGQLDEALRDLTTALKYQPQSSVMMSNRALIYQDTGSLHAARQEYEAALTHAKTWQERSLIFVSLASLWRRMGDPERALKYCDQAEQQAGSNNVGKIIRMGSLIVKAMIVFDRQQPELAYRGFEAAYHLMPNSSPAMAHYALVQLMQGHEAAARELWAKLLERNPLYANPEWVIAIHHLHDCPAAMMDAVDQLAN